MSSFYSIDDSLYKALLDSLNNLYMVESKGNVHDFYFFYDDLWLSDTAVIDYLQYSKGEWGVELLFALHSNPLKFIKRHITSYSCPKKANLTASLMRRLAAKDQRGTLQVKIEDMEISKN